MPTKGEPHENLVLFEDDLYKGFYSLVNSITEHYSRQEEKIDGPLSMAIVSTINGARLMVEELLKKESNDDEV